MIFSSPVVVGRRQELALLDGALAGARSGEGRAVFLLGEAGLGKSRLAEECARHAQAAGMAVLRGRASVTGGAVPFRPVAEALLSLFRAGGPAQDASLAPYRSALAGLVPDWRDGAPAGPAPSTIEIAEAFLRVLAATARGPTPDRVPDSTAASSAGSAHSSTPGPASGSTPGPMPHPASGRTSGSPSDPSADSTDSPTPGLAPGSTPGRIPGATHSPVPGPASGCLLVVEDLHDADAETLAVIEYLADNCGALPVVLLATLRPEDGPAADLVRSAGRRRSAVLAELHPLGRAEVGALAHHCLGAEPGRLPESLVDRLARVSDGNPFVIEELLSGMAAAGSLRGSAESGWQTAEGVGAQNSEDAPRGPGHADTPGTPGTEAFGGTGPTGATRNTADTATPALAGLEDLGTLEVPQTVVHSVAQRVDRLGPGGREMLIAAAVLGRRFTLPVLALVTGLDAPALLTHLKAGVAARLVAPSGPDAERYEFQHTLTAEALLAGLLPFERAALARRAADAIERAYPGLPGDWRHQVAMLRIAAGQPMAAALLFAEAGRTALASGAVGSAVSLLERAHELTAGCDAADPVEAAVCTEVRESLVHALAETGRLDQAVALAGDFPLSGPGALGDARAVELHVHLAWAAVTAGRLGEAAAQAAQVRALLARSGGSAPAPALDIVAAHLVLAGDSGGTADRTAEAERLARRAAEHAEEAGLIEVACQSWQLLALLERRHGFDRADACLERLLALATRHDLPTWRVDALMRLGANDVMRTGSSAQLELAHRAALGLGALALMHTTEASLAIQAVFRGEYAQARDLADRCGEATARLGSVETHQFVLVTRAAMAAHQGRRREMERELAEFRRWEGDRSLHVPLVHGNCQAVCALLEEDRDRALSELDRAWSWEEENPIVFYLNGRYGLRPLLRALAGTLEPGELAAVGADPAAGLRWNRQFERLALAVREGRAGRQREAVRAFEEAQEAAEPFAMARHLGLRLVAEAALEDGWGDPVAWLRTAEEHFHTAGVAPVAGACRRLIRRAGARIPQRRADSAAVPAELRGLGLTAREYEVFQLIAHRYGNQDIARRLHISPRTVEKHVASLLAKTGHPDRAGLSEHAAEAAARLATSDD